MLQEKKFDTGEVILNYAEGPKSGLPLILIHGLPGRWQEFLPLLPSLTLRWQVFALDMRGQGFSSHTAGRYLPSNYTADLISFIQNQVRKPVFLFGMSAGGMTALHAASIIPDLVQGLILGDSPIDLKALAAWMNSVPFAAHFTEVKELVTQQMPVKNLAEALGNMPVRMMGGESPPKFREVRDGAYLLEWAKTIHSMDPEVLSYHADGRGDDYLNGLDTDAAFRKVQCPTLLIRADPKLGALMSAEACDHAASLLPQPFSAFLENTPHSLGLDSWNSAPVLRILYAFLESIITNDGG